MRKRKNSKSLTIKTPFTGFIDPQQQKDDPIFNEYVEINNDSIQYVNDKDEENMLDINLQKLKQVNKKRVGVAGQTTRMQMPSKKAKFEQKKQEQLTESVLKRRGRVKLNTSVQIPQIIDNKPKQTLFSKHISDAFIKNQMQKSQTPQDGRIRSGNFMDKRTRKQKIDKTKNTQTPLHISNQSNMMPQIYKGMVQYTRQGSQYLNEDSIVTNSQLYPFNQLMNNTQKRPTSYVHPSGENQNSNIQAFINDNNNFTPNEQNHPITGSRKNTIITNKEFHISNKTFKLDGFAGVQLPRVNRPYSSQDRVRSNQFGYRLAQMRYKQSTQQLLEHHETESQVANHKRSSSNHFSEILLQNLRNNQNEIEMIQNLQQQQNLMQSSGFPSLLKQNLENIGVMQDRTDISHNNRLKRLQQEHERLINQNNKLEESIKKIRDNSSSKPRSKPDKRSEQTPIMCSESNIMRGKRKNRYKSQQISDHSRSKSGKSYLSGKQRRKSPIGVTSIHDYKLEGKSDEQIQVKRECLTSGQSKPKGGSNKKRLMIDNNNQKVTIISANKTPSITGNKKLSIIEKRVKSNKSAQSNAKSTSKNKKQQLRQKSALSNAKRVIPKKIGVRYNKSSKIINRTDNSPLQLRLIKSFDHSSENPFVKNSSKVTSLTGAVNLQLNVNIGSKRKHISYQRSLSSQGSAMKKSSKSKIISQYVEQSLKNEIPHHKTISQSAHDMSHHSLKLPGSPKDNQQNQNNYDFKMKIMIDKSCQKTIEKIMKSTKESKESYISNAKLKMNLLTNDQAIAILNPSIQEKKVTMSSVKVQTKQIINTQNAFVQTTKKKRDSLLSMSDYKISLDVSNQPESNETQIIAQTEEESEDSWIVKRKMPSDRSIMSLFEQPIDQLNTFDQANKLLSIKKKQNDGSISPRMPQIRTIFQELNENLLFKYIDYYSSLSEQKTIKMNKYAFDDLEFKDIINLSHPQRELQLNAKQEKNEEVAKFHQEITQEVENIFKYRNISNPEDRLTLKQGHHLLRNDKKIKQVKNMIKDHSKRIDQVKVEMFKENTRHWRLSYDPYSQDKVRQIYGNIIPHSFKMRQLAFEEQRVVLERYSFARPILNKELVEKQIKTDTKAFCIDSYFVKKKFERYISDQKDIKELQKALQTEQQFKIKPLRHILGFQKFINKQKLFDFHTKSLQDAGSRDKWQEIVCEKYDRLEEKLREVDLVTKKFLLSRDQSDYEQRQKYENLLFDCCNYGMSLERSEITILKHCLKIAEKSFKSPIQPSKMNKTPTVIRFNDIDLNQDLVNQHQLYDTYNKPRSIINFLKPSSKGRDKEHMLKKYIGNDDLIPYVLNSGDEENRNQRLLDEKKHKTKLKVLDGIFWIDSTNPKFNRAKQVYGIEQSELFRDQKFVTAAFKNVLRRNIDKIVYFFDHEFKLFYKKPTVIQQVSEESQEVSDETEPISLNFQRPQLYNQGSSQQYIIDQKAKIDVKSRQKKDPNVKKAYSQKQELLQSQNKNQEKIEPAKLSSHFHSQYKKSQREHDLYQVEKQISFLDFDLDNPKNFTIFNKFSRFSKCPKQIDRFFNLNYYQAQFVQNDDDPNHFEVYQIENINQRTENTNYNRALYNVLLDRYLVQEDQVIDMIKERSERRIKLLKKHKFQFQMQVAKHKMQNKIKTKSKSISYSENMRVNSDVKNIWFEMLNALKPYDDYLFWERSPPILSQEEMQSMIYQKLQYKPLPVERENMTNHLKNIETELRDFIIKTKKLMLKRDIADSPYKRKQYYEPQYQNLSIIDWVQCLHHQSCQECIQARSYWPSKIVSEEISNEQSNVYPDDEKYANYFKIQLYKQMELAIEKHDLFTIQNFVSSLHGNVKTLITQQDVYGRTLIDKAKLQVKFISPKDTIARKEATKIIQILQQEAYNDGIKNLSLNQSQQSKEEKESKQKQSQSEIKESNQDEDLSQSQHRQKTKIIIEGVYD